MGPAVRRDPPTPTTGRVTLSRIPRSSTTVDLSALPYPETDGVELGEGGAAWQG